MCWGGRVTEVKMIRFKGACVSSRCGINYFKAEMPQSRVVGTSLPQWFWCNQHQLQAELIVGSPCGRCATPWDVYLSWSNLNHSKSLWFICIVLIKLMWKLIVSQESWGSSLPGFYCCLCAIYTHVLTGSIIAACLRVFIRIICMGIHVPCIFIWYYWYCCVICLLVLSIFII